MKSNSTASQLDDLTKTVALLKHLYVHFPANSSYKRGLAKARNRLRMFKLKFPSP